MSGRIRLAIVLLVVWVVSWVLSPILANLLAHGVSRDRGVSRRHDERAVHPQPDGALCKAMAYRDMKRAGTYKDPDAPTA